MAAQAEVNVAVSIQGLGKGIEVKDNYVDTTAPDTAIHIPEMTQTTADVAEALDVGSVSTIRGIIIRAIDGDIAVDTSFNSTFSSELLISEGQSQLFCPVGTVYIKNNTALETVKFEYVVFGEQ